MSNEDIIAHANKKEIKAFQKAAIATELSDACIKHQRDRKAWKYRMKYFKYARKAWDLVNARIPELVQEGNLRVNNITGAITKIEPDDV